MVNRRIIDQTEAISLSGDDYLVADNVNLGTRKIQFTRLLSGATPLPPDYIVGFRCLRTDDTEFSVNSGYARSSDNLRNIQLTTSLIKDVSATFNLGNNTGCMPSGLTLQANTKYYIFAISTSGGQTDIIVDTNQNCTNGLSDNVASLNNFDKYTLLGSFKTNSISQIQGTIYYKTAGVLIDSYENGYSFYRLYADGWCEQGGYYSSNNTLNGYTGLEIIISLLIPYASNTYRVITSKMNSIGNQYASIIATPDELTTQNFRLKFWNIANASSSNTVVRACWYALGFVNI